MGKLAHLVGWAAVLSVLAVVLSGTAGAATTWTVCPSGCNFTTIPAALGAASNGDTVSVHAGTYSGGFAITKSIRLVGAGASTTLIRGGSPVVTVGTSPFVGPPPTSQPTVLISGVTIRDGTADPTTPFFAAGGVQNFGRLTLSGSVVAGNSGFDTGGILNQGGLLELNGSAVRENHIDGDFGSAGILSFGIAKINNSTINRNSTTSQSTSACAAIQADEIFNYDVVGLTLNNSSVVGNDGHGICLVAGKFLLQNSTVSDNHGIGIQSLFVDATVYNRLVVSNNGGGGILNDVLDLVFSNVSVESSQIVGNKGVGVASTGLGNIATTTISNSTVARNTAQRCAGTDQVVSITGSTITENKAVTDGGGVCGGTTVSNSTVSRNRAGGNGGGLNGTFTITNTAISGNQAGGYGGGLWGGGTITGSRFERNTAGIDGGGIWNVFGVHLLGTTFSNNIPNDCANDPSSPPAASC